MEEVELDSSRKICSAYLWIFLISIFLSYPTSFPIILTCGRPISDTADRWVIIASSVQMLTAERWVQTAGSVTFPAARPSLALRTGCGCSCAERGSGSGVWGEAPLWLLKYNFRIMQGMLRNYIWRKRMEYNKEMKAHYCRKLFVSWLSQWLSKFVFTHFLPFLNLWTFPLYHLFQFFENILNRHFLWCKNVFLYMFMVRESIYLSVVRRIIPPDNKLSPLRYMISISLKFGCGMLLDIEFPAIY